MINSLDKGTRDNSAALRQHLVARNADAQERGLWHSSLGLHESKELNRKELCGGLAGTSWVKHPHSSLSEIATSCLPDGSLNP